MNKTKQRKQAKILCARINETTGKNRKKQKNPWVCLLFCLNFFWCIPVEFH